jgi:hypothetical protein
MNETPEHGAVDEAVAWRTAENVGSILFGHGRSAIAGEVATHLDGIADGVLGAGNTGQIPPRASATKRRCALLAAPRFWMAFSHNCRAAVVILNPVGCAAFGLLPKAPPDVIAAEDIDHIAREVGRLLAAYLFANPRRIGTCRPRSGGAGALSDENDSGRSRILFRWDDPRAKNG